MGDNRSRETQGRYACPQCHDGLGMVVCASRPETGDKANQRFGGPYIRRRRLCPACGCKISTYEITTDQLAAIESKYEPSVEEALAVVNGALGRMVNG